ncbi:MAG: GerMN domain-containing protein [Ilumatobacteraceae bacterium]
MTTHRALTAAFGVVVVAVAAVSACGIDPDSGPRAVPAERRLELDPVTQDAGRSSGASRVFLLVEGDSGRVLRSVLRDVPSEPGEVLRTLFAGPNEQEVTEGLQTALPAEIEVLSARRVADTLVVDLSAPLELQSTALRLAVAQIVFTASELPGIDSVRLRVAGQVRAWPAGRGDLQTESLTVYDFPGYAESALPPYPPIPASTVP